MNTQAAAPDLSAGKTVFVFDGYVRLCHWAYVLCILTLIATGLLIAYPLPSVDGEASDHFVMGYVRFTHFAAGQALALAFLLRVYAAIVGNAQSREIYVLPLRNGAWWRGVWTQILHYLFLEAEPPKSIGHNPFAQMFMWLFSSVFVVFQLLTGLALFSEGKGAGSWQDALFGWVIPLFGGSQAVHSWHHLGMWAVICFVIVHLYMITREEIMSRQSIFSAMISGFRSYHD